MAIPVDKFQHVWLILSEHGPSSASERLVLLAISAATNNSQSEAWPSQETIAERAQLSVRQVKRLVKSAEAHGWVTRRKARKPGATWSFTVYGLTVPPALLSVIPDHPWDLDPDWKRGAKPVTPSSEQGAKPVTPSIPQLPPNPLPQGSPNGCEVTSSGSDVPSMASKVTNDGESKVTNGASKVPSGWPTKFPSDAPRDVPQYEPSHGPRRTARAGPSDRIREDDPEVRRRRREANRLVEELAARARR